MQQLFPVSRADLSERDLIELYRWPAGQGPAVVRSNFISTLDGSVQGLDGRSGSINTASDNRIFALQRALCDVVLVGAGTVRAEGYRAIDLTSAQREIRLSEGLREFPLLVIVSNSLRLDPTLASPPDDHGPVLVATQASARSGPSSAELDGLEIWSAPTEQSLLPALLRMLAEQSLTRILCEGGPTLHRDLLAGGLLDQLLLSVAPNAVGGVGRRSTAGPPLAKRADFQLSQLLRGADDTLFTSYFREARSSD